MTKQPDFWMNHTVFYNILNDSFGFFIFLLYKLIYFFKKKTLDYDGIFFFNVKLLHTYIYYYYYYFILARLLKKNSRKF